MPAKLLIVPISIGYLGHQPELIQQYGAAVADLLHHLRSDNSQQQQQECVQPSAAAAAAAASGNGSHEVVLIVTSDFTHAGPWYRELPPAGVSLADYMTAQDSPLLQVRARQLMHWDYHIYYSWEYSSTITYFIVRFMV
jgi:hypothetical protein